MTDEHKSTQRGQPREEIVRPLVEIARRGEVLPPDPRQTFPLVNAEPQRIMMPERGYVSRLEGTHDPITEALASQIHARGDIKIAGIIALTLVALVWIVYGGDLEIYVLGGLLAWGCVSLYALNRNRRASYQHSPAGVAQSEQASQERVALAEIASREAVALHGIDRATEIIKAHYRIEDQQ